MWWRRFSWILIRLTLLILYDQSGERSQGVKCTDVQQEVTTDTQGTEAVTSAADTGLTDTQQIVIYNFHPDTAPCGGVLCRIVNRN